MRSERVESNPEFLKRQTLFVQDFAFNHMPQIRSLKKHGLFSKTEEHDWRGVIRHSLTGALVVETLCDLLHVEDAHKNYLVNTYILHDQDKREQFDSMSMSQIIRDENKKTGILRVTGNNFTDFDAWGIDEYILRFADSSVTTELIPWRERISSFKADKIEENEMGRQLYDGMGTWDKLEEIMVKIEKNLYEAAIDRSPTLKDKYPTSKYLQDLIQDIIITRINR